MVFQQIPGFVCQTGATRLEQVRGDWLLVSLSSISLFPRPPHRNTYPEIIIVIHVNNGHPKKYIYNEKNYSRFRP